jgi:hypothetical protein
MKDGLPRPEQRKSAEVAIALGLAQSDPVAGVAMARELNNVTVFVGSLNAAAKIGPGTLAQVLEANDGKFSAGITIPRVMFRFPELPWDRLKPDKELADGSSIEVSVTDEARRILPEERQSILSRLAHFPPQVGGDAMAAILWAWAPDDPKGATEWAFANAQFATNGVFSQWMTSNPDAALAWFATVPASEVRDRLGNTAAIPMAARGDIEQAMAYFRPAAGKEGEAQVTQMALAQAKSDPARAAAWCESLPDEIDTSIATESVVTAWFSKDAAAAAQWVESQPDGKRRESALRAYSKVASTQDAAAAGEWAAAIKDPAMRASAAKYVYTAMLEKNRDEAAKWIAEFPGIDERVRTAVLRSQNP